MLTKNTADRLKTRAWDETGDSQGTDSLDFTSGNKGGRAY
jgi:hypothetical protein